MINMTNFDIDALYFYLGSCQNVAYATADDDRLVNHRAVRIIDSVTGNTLKLTVNPNGELVGAEYVFNGEKGLLTPTIYYVIRDYQEQKFCEILKSFGD